MTRKSFFFLAPVFLWLMSLHYGLDYFVAQRAGVEWAAAGLVSLLIWKRYGFLVGALAGYLIGSLIWVAFWPANQLEELGTLIPVICRASLAGGFSTLIIICAVWLKPVSRQTMSKLFVAFGIMNCAHFWVFKHWYQREGFLMTPTLAGVYLVLCLPLLRGGGAPWLFTLFSFTIVATGGHACILGLAAWITGTLWVNEPKILKYWLGFCAAIAAGIWSALGTDWIFRDHGRMKIWRLAMTWWNEIDRPAFGAGAGTWYSIVPSIQKATKTLDQGRFGMSYGHNEYLQILFELGWVGLGLVLAFWFVAVVRSKTRGDYRSAGFLLALAACSISMFPLRHDALLFVVMFNLYEVLENSFKRVRLES